MPTFGGLGFGGGTPKAVASSATGTYTVDTSSRPGKTIYTFNNSGSITIANAGICELMVLGGGGGANAGSQTFFGAGGGAGTINSGTYYIPAGTFTVTIGAGGTGTGNNNNHTSGNPSSVVFNGSIEWKVRSYGGGRGFDQYGGSNVDYSGGFNAGVATGGGAGSGGSASGSTPGVGVALSISGTSITYGRGGNANATQSALPANQGHGGSGGGNALTTGQSGSSGVVIFVFG